MSKQEFLQKVEKLAAQNQKVRKLLDTKGGFDKLVDHQKQSIAIMVGVEYKKTVITKETFIMV